MGFQNWRHAQGRAAEAAGRGAESALAELHAIYYAQGRAWIGRRPAEVGRRWDKATHAQIVTRSTACGADFAGYLRGGRGIAVEAKTVADGSRLTGVREFPAAQIEELRAAAQMGSVGLIVADVRAGDHAGRYVVPVTRDERWDRAFAGFVASIPLVGPEALVWGVLRVKGADWLAVVEAAGMREFGARWPHERREAA